MLKIFATVTLGLALLCETAAVTSAQTIAAPNPPGVSYTLPGVPVTPADGLYEGRSIYRMGDPSTFPGDSDEMGYPTGNPENPHIPN